MSIAGHVSRALLSRYSHVPMEAKRWAPYEVASRQHAAAERHKGDAELREQPTMVSQSALVQQFHGGGT